MDVGRPERLRPPSGISRSRARERFSEVPNPIHDIPDFNVEDRSDDSGGRLHGWVGPVDEPEFDENELPETAGSEYPAADPRLSDTSSSHAECFACPVGSTYSALRGRRPEGMDRLANALADLAEVLAGTIEAFATEGRKKRSGSLEHIDIE